MQDSTSINGLNGGRAGAVPLPGLAKLFLVQAYLLLPVLLLAQIVFFFASGEVYRDRDLVEVTLWQIASFGLCVWNLMVIVGLHTRAVWAPTNSVRFCRGMMLLALALALRLCTLLVDMHIDLDYGYGAFYEIYILLMPALLLVFCLQLLAWSRYFQCSAGLRAAFGLEAPASDGRGADLGRPLGVALLHLFCGGLLLFYLAFYPSLWIAGSGLSGGMVGLMLLLGWPQVVFPVLLLALSYRPGKAFLPLHVCFGAWLLLGTLWSAFIPAIAFSGIFESDGPLLYRLHFIVGNFPIPSYALPVALAALWWRLAASKEDAVWFVGRDPSSWEALGEARLTVILSGYAVYYLIAHCSYFIHGLIMEPGAPEICLAALFLTLLVLAGLSMRRNLKGDPRGRAAFLALSGGGLLFLAGLVALLVWRNLGSEAAGFIIGYSLPYLTLEMGIVAGGLYFVLRSRPDQFLELTIFKLFCLAMLCMFVLPRLVQFCFILSTDAGRVGPAFLSLLGGMAKEPGYYGDVPEMLFSPAFLTAFTVLPLAILALLRAGRAGRLSRPAFLAWLGVWLMLMELARAAQTVLSNITGGGGPAMLNPDPKMGLASAALLMFLFYFCSSGRFARWTEGAATP